jgi:N-acyl homoserine lactone hydrolase
MTLRLLLLVACAALATQPAAAPPAPPELRLYVLDCGHATIDDAAIVSDTGELDGKPLALADPCFVIRHPRGWLLWDAGLAPDQPSYPGLDIHAGPPVEAQLRAIGLGPDDITYVAFSHLHFDHVGNAKLFPHATWILSADELGWAEHEPAHASMLPALFAAYRTARTRVIDGDFDVFGDGRVRILRAPGHTPGSAVLWIDLRDTGPVILSGDLFLSRDGRRQRFTAAVNASRAETLASIDRVEHLARRRHARIVIQHDPKDYAELPRLPAFLH